ncbi:hypothetical protein A0O28_0044760 [Trichoderma guizhouense]|uniref:Nucleoside phosphorylase domain-containing protein n=1 Tax=Trichoderma guizhouense TaxID=1491466 RepID=A0A1T3C901_9HYPO|nr:hypothetical protein A0O28_0044760 [Trichoderma guizhouense]
MSDESTICYDHDAYTIGWICALPEEAEPAGYLLDHEHPLLRNPPSDINTYTLGSIGKHNVAIACLPAGTIGVTPAATVAQRMVSTFPNIKICLMVGIGGGIPSKVELGDVVISQSKNGNAAVVQWDLGKTQPDGTFKRTGHLNNPPTAVMSALSLLKTKRLVRRKMLSDYLELLQTMPDLEGVYDKPKLTKDQMQVTGGNKGKNEAVNIHYGLIASGSQVIKHTPTRDKINADFNGDVLCIEMEAAGLMNEFPCIVIRGICDYADEQKNDVWHEYAAAVASVCAKALINCLPENEVKGMRAIQDIIPNLLKRFWPGKTVDDTATVKPTKNDNDTQLNDASQTNKSTSVGTDAQSKLNDVSQTNKSTDGGTDAQSKETQHPDPLKQASEPEHSSSAQVEAIESGMNDINLGQKLIVATPNRSSNSDLERAKGLQTLSPEPERDYHHANYQSQGPSPWNGQSNRPLEAPPYQDCRQMLFSQPSQYQGNRPDWSNHLYSSGNSQIPPFAQNNIGAYSIGPQNPYHQQPVYQSPVYGGNGGHPDQYANNSYGHNQASGVWNAMNFSGNGWNNGGQPAMSASGPHNAFASPKLNDPQIGGILFQSVKRGDTAATERLLQSGVDLEIKDTFGHTPLWVAAQNKQLDLMKLLLRYGASQEATNINGQTILAWAMQRRFTNIVDILNSARVPVYNGYY